MKSVSLPHWLVEVGHAIDAKDTQKFLSYLTSDAIFRYGSSKPVVGIKEIELAIDGFFKSIESLTHTPINYWEKEGSVVLEGVVSYVTLKGTTVDVPFCDVLYFRNEKVYKWLVYIDPTPVFT